MLLLYEILWYTFRLLWSPAPPKLSLYPATIQSHLFPKYMSHKPQQVVDRDGRDSDDQDKVKGQLRLGGK